MTFPAEGERRALVRALVAEFAPEELPDFDLMTKAYFASPGAARRARKPRDEPGGFTFDPGDPTFTNLMWAVIGGLATEAIVVGVRSGGSRLKRLLGKRKAEPGPDAPLPVLRPGAETSERSRIAGQLAQMGYPEAEAVAERTVDRWGRRDWTPPG
ncbi:hypothetical protein [Streptosporangium sp. NPDC000396]|uniref:hypothetical protein n=1 Tax=Streptosporangium sp. NPDC000396 TaxID=3366185 RepID=UPI003681D360